MSTAHPSANAAAEEQAFVVYDARAILGDTDDAAVLVACGSLSEAWRYLRWEFGSGAIYSYRIDTNREAKDETLVGWLDGEKEWHA